MYKLQFPLDDYKRVNSLIANYFTEYVYSGHWVYGTSINTWSFHMIDIEASMGREIENLLIPPNHMRTILGDLRKTKAYIDSNEKEFNVYTFEDKITENKPDIAKGQLVLSIERTPPMSQTVPGKRVTEIVEKSEHFYDLLIQNQAFMELDMDDILTTFSNDAPCEFIDDLTGDIIILTREMFPNHKKILDLSWESVPINDDFSWAIFRVRYDAGTVFTFVKYIRQLR